MRSRVRSTVWQLTVRAQFILWMPLLISACESSSQLQKTAAPIPLPAPLEVFSEKDVVSTFVRAETGDAYCNLMGNEAFKNNLLAAVNLLRAKEQKCGAQTFPASAPLVWSVKLQKAAYEHSSQMAITNVVSHTSIDGRRPAERVQAVAYRFATLGENICAGAYDVPGVIKAWLNSPSHCQQMLSPAYTELGVACVKLDNTYYRRYWTMNLASPRLEVAPVAPVVQ